MSNNGTTTGTNTGTNPDTKTATEKGAENDLAKQYIDPDGYWVDPARNVRRKGGEQEIIVSAAGACSDLEWSYIFDAIRDCIPKMRA